jgi:DNA repair exonuclease SbcCD nuclease subunit
MKLVILGDTHFGARGDSLDFHRFFQRFYDEVFFPYLLENDIKVVVQLGDLFDRRKFINFNSLYLARKYFFNKLKEHNITMYTLLGNHDVAYKNTLEVNSSSMLLKEYDNVTVFDEFATIDFGGVPIDVIPWLCDDNEDEIFTKIKESKSQICFGHFEISGFEMDRGNVSDVGIDKKTLNKYDMVITGHFHHKSDDGHIFYTGTPYEMTWADYQDDKGFHVFDTATRNMEFIVNPNHMFRKVMYDDSKQDFEFWKQYDYPSLKDCYVKVVVINKQNPYLFDNVLDNLYKAGLSDISIVEDFTDTAFDTDQDIIDQAEDTMTILSKYIDNLQLQVEPEKLKNIMRELYVEALNTEVAE